MATHEIKQGDTRPYWPVTLTFDDGTVPDLTGGSVRFIARERSDNSIIIDTPAVLTTPAAGQCEWRPSAGQTDIAGRYDVEWEATYADATKQTFPTRRFDRLKVIGDLA